MKSETKTLGQEAAECALKELYLTPAARDRLAEIIDEVVRGSDLYLDHERADAIYSLMYDTGLSPEEVGRTLMRVGIADPDEIKKAIADKE